jgi:cobalt/nickel transport system ATP-binding protein/precorrin-8X/cobalt-precorrin-8 methylmutase
MTRAKIHQLYERPLTGEAIERESFRRIDAELSGHGLSAAEWQVARRLVHTTADFSLLRELVFGHDALARGVGALRNGAPIYADSNMIRAGISLARLSRCCASYSTSDLHVHVADAEVSTKARSAGLPRAIYALRKARSILDGAIVCFGNSPVGLLELNRMILEEGIMPALVVAMPVGFVHVVECKEELMSLNVPQIVIRGRRGGSPLAVATVHALCSLVTESLI